MESLKITTSQSTRYEDRQDRSATKEAFFSDLRGSDRIEVKGRLDGNSVSAEKVEFD